MAFTAVLSCHHSCGSRIQALLSAVLNLGSPQAVVRVSHTQVTVLSEGSPGKEAAQDPFMWLLPGVSAFLPVLLGVSPRGHLAHPSKQTRGEGEEEEKVQGREAEQAGAQVHTHKTEVTVFCDIILG